MLLILVAAVLALLALIALVRRRAAVVAPPTPRSAPSPEQPNVESVINNPAGDGVVPAAMLPGSGRGYFMAVVGESYYQSALQQLRAGADKSGEVSVLVVADPQNSHDGHAVVVKTFTGETIGYLSRDDAPRYQPTLLELRARGLMPVCSARLYGDRGNKPNVGIWLDLEVPTAVAIIHRGLDLARLRDVLL